MLVGGTDDRQAMLEAQRRAEEARRQAEIARQRAEEAKRQQEAQAKEAQLEAAMKAQKAQGTDQLKAEGSGPLEGAGHKLELGDTPWAAQDASAKEAKMASFPQITADDLKSEPALGKQLAQMAKDPDPDVQQYVKDTVTSAMKESLRQNLQDHPGDGALDAFKQDIAAMSAKTGLGDVMKAVSGAALSGAAKDLLNQGVSAQQVKDNPALGKVLATLQSDPDPAVQAKLADTVKGWANDALTHAMDGKEGEDGVKDGIKAFQDQIRDLANATGLGDALTKGAEGALNDQKDHIKDLGDKGKPFWKKGLDFLGDVVGKALDFGGDLVKDTAHIMGDTVSQVSDVVAEGVKAGADLAGDAANAAVDAAGKGAHGVADATAAGLDAVGADGAAKDVRQAGAKVEQVADKAGNLANTMIDTQGKITGGAIGLGGHALGALERGAGDLAGGAMHVAGALAADGPMGAANKLADKAIGPEKAEYMGQIDGFTGVVTNRLGKGDAVYMKMQVGAEVGIGADAGASVGAAGATEKNDAFVGAKLNGGATLSRDSNGMIQLQLSVGGGVEAGVRHEDNATIAGQGVEAEARASAQAGATGKITLKFDPNNPADVKRLKALTEPTPEKILAAAGNPLAAATITGPALADAMAHNEVSREIATTVGAGTSASASAKLGPIAAEAGVSADAVAGYTQKFNKDGTVETTMMLRAGAGASVKAGGGPVSASAGVGANAVMAVTVKKDAQGNLIGLSGEEGGNTSASAKAGASGGGASGGGDHVSTSTTTKSLTPEGLAEAKRRIAAGENVVSVFSALNDKPGMHRDVTTTTTSDQITVGFKPDVALAVDVGINAQITVGKSHTDSTPDGHDPSSLHRDLDTTISTAQNRS